MALIKEYITPEGASFNYWKIHVIHVYTESMKMEFVLIPFRSKEDRLNDMKPYGIQKIVTISFTYEELEAAPNMIKFGYNKAKENKSTGDGEDDNPFFFDAVDDI